MNFLMFDYQPLRMLCVSTAVWVPRPLPLLLPAIFKEVECSGLGTVQLVLEKENKKGFASRENQPPSSQERQIKIQCSLLHVVTSLIENRTERRNKRNVGN